MLQAATTILPLCQTVKMGVTTYQGQADAEANVQEADAQEADIQEASTESFHLGSEVVNLMQEAHAASSVATLDEDSVSISSDSCCHLPGQLPGNGLLTHK
ncbi:hypothetical protein WJX77_007524 [Trebouxia sp. C0004]